MSAACIYGAVCRHMNRLTFSGVSAKTNWQAVDVHNKTNVHSWLVLLNMAMYPNISMVVLRWCMVHTGQGVCMRFPLAREDLGTHIPVMRVRLVRHVLSMSAPLLACNKCLFSFASSLSSLMQRSDGTNLTYLSTCTFRICTSLI